MINIVEGGKEEEEEEEEDVAFAQLPLVESLGKGLPGIH